MEYLTIEKISNLLENFESIEKAEITITRNYLSIAVFSNNQYMIKEELEESLNDYFNNSVQIVVM